MKVEIETIKQGECNVCGAVKEAALLHIEVERGRTLQGGGMYVGEVTEVLRIRVVVCQSCIATQLGEFRKSGLMDVKDVREILLTAERMGAEVDAPEGARYIQISETLVNKMVEALTRKEQ